MKLDKPNQLLFLTIILLTALNYAGSDCCCSSCPQFTRFWFNDQWMIILEIFKRFLMPLFVVFFFGFILMERNKRRIDFHLLKIQLSFIVVFLLSRILFSKLEYLKCQSPNWSILSFYDKPNVREMLFNLTNSMSIFCVLLSCYFFYLILKKGYTTQKE
jgi:hypothetical protein